jgi:hypothetical protein
VYILGKTMLMFSLAFHERNNPVEHKDTTYAPWLGCNTSGINTARSRRRMAKEVMAKQQAESRG